MANFKYQVGDILYLVDIEEMAEQYRKKWSREPYEDYYETEWWEQMSQHAGKQFTVANVVDSYPKAYYYSEECYEKITDTDHYIVTADFLTPFPPNHLDDTEQHEIFSLFQ